MTELGAPINRIGHREVFYEKRNLKCFPKLTGKILPWSHFTGFQPATVLNKESSADVFLSI